MCRHLGVSRAGYYAWRSRPPCARDRADMELVGVIKAIHNRSRGPYGAPRVHAELALEFGIRCGRKRVARLMRRRDRRRASATEDRADDPGPKSHAGAGPRQPGLPGQRAGPGMGRRHHPAPHLGGLAVPRRRRGRLKPEGGRVGHGQLRRAKLVVEALQMAVAVRRPPARCRPSLGPVNTRRWHSAGRFGSAASLVPWDRRRLL
jgi:HTH-like domain